MHSLFWKMKISWLAAAASLALTASGCSSTHHPTAAATPAVAAPKPIVTPDFSLSARVVSVNTIGRFVILSFPTGQMPRLEQTLFLYRDGLKTAEVRVTGPQQDSNIVADLVSGDAQVGDTVSDK
ncbi:MAG: hypothetical protein ABUL66_00805 [Verrucomicrobiota bacterium]